MPGVVTATILSDGKPIGAKRVLLSLDIEKEVNRIGTASVTLKDGDPTKGKFELCDTDFFEHGKEIEIKLRYEGGQDLTVFKGIVISKQLRADSGISYLTIELKDKAVKLTRVRKNCIFEGMKDSAIITEIIKDLKGPIDETAVEHEQMVQYYTTDWDFILSRSDVNGHIVINDDGTISSQAPEFSKEPTHTFEYGGSGLIYSFEVEADIRNQFKQITGKTWDSIDQQILDDKSDDFSLKQGDLKLNNLKTIFGSDEYDLITDLYKGKEEVKAWADAKMIKDRLSMLRGCITVKGDATIKPGYIIELKGLGNNFNGTTMVTGLRHQVTEKGWLTHVQFGLENDWFSKKDIIKRPASGLLPAVSGLQTGVVEAFKEDKDGMFRIKVNLPFIGNEKNTVWARLISQDAGNNRGIFFIPEKGDEVIVGFLNDDPRQAIVLGSLFGKKNVPPEPFKIDDKNPSKGIVTKESLKFIFNDTEKSVEITTPSGNSILVKDEEGISLKDKNGNEFVLDKNGITVKSAKDINIEGQNIIVKGQSVEIN